jgi:hypothetical protein
MNHLQEGDEMNIDTIARQRLDDHYSSVRLHLAERTTIRAMQSANPAVSQMTSRPEPHQSTAARRTAAAERPAF